MAGLAPGASVSGNVTIANTGVLRGYFYLTQSRLTDAVGPSGGALSGALRLTVTDVTSPGAPRRIYSGPFAAMGAEPVGFIGPTAARRFRFDASLPRDADPAGFEGSSTSVRYVWSALGDAPRRDRRPPGLRVALPPVQRVIERNELLVEARCDEPCRLGLTGTVSAGERAAVPPIRDRRVAARRPELLEVGIPPDMRRAREARARGIASRGSAASDQRPRPGGQPVAGQAYRAAPAAALTLAGVSVVAVARGVAHADADRERQQAQAQDDRHHEACAGQAAAFVGRVVRLGRGRVAVVGHRHLYVHAGVVFATLLGALRLAAAA